ncbi:MAG: 2-amino-4-hydroxy-6-hydroxymethyldihydropteridine diphosphokinase [Kordiimonadaceae bacterium]|nr:2-amino-4-hydroxy-6-hydroxymethyldihydropteridine diphosphokinase [Kordiimonadaceae bacterium]MBO6569907.1 2-amino-4-hydroxy-6-hydroxymethyldihydropteridine diphosphokinase [Kordiimonadaceae bacterium]MBO6965997.1 2-amino-4-hydroxy-6-hydroxymethyldihydropteridine diphosphokinase [Kordiimonadaceae bacterium]
MKRLKDGTECILGLGANLPFAGAGPAPNLRAAINEISATTISNVTVSGFYLSTPVPHTDQPDFVNCVMSGTTQLSAKELMARCQSMETQYGRERDGRWQARTLDIDILDYGGQILPTAGDWTKLMQDGRDGTIAADLIVPHPRLHERGFVLKPLAEIWPDWSHPVLGKTALELLNSLGSEEVDDVRPIFAE